MHNLGACPYAGEAATTATIYLRVLPGLQVANVREVKIIRAATTVVVARRA